MKSEIKHYHIYFDPEIDSVIMEWDGYSTSKEFKEGTEYMLKVLRESQAKKVLADIKDMTLIGLEDQKWLEENFLPRAIAAGFNTIALVKPDYYFNKVAIESISERIDNTKLSLKVFDHISEARNWIKTK